jgi:cytochrome P450
MRCSDLQTMMIDLDLASSELLSDPYPYFARLLENDPVHWSDTHRAWLVTRYADVAIGLRHPSLSADRVTPMIERSVEEEGSGFRMAMQILSKWMVFNDPPDHRRLRGVFHDAFTPRVIRGMRETISEVVNQLIEPLESPGTIDLVRAFAFPLPAIVIARLLGIPSSDVERFKEWSGNIAPLIFGALKQVERNALAQQALLELADYMTKLVHLYRGEPADNLISRVVESGSIGDTVTEYELVGMLTHLLFAGHETTTNTIATGIRQLLMEPRELARLKMDPRLDTTAPDELLRFDGPAKLVVRSVSEDLQLGGAQLRKGERVFLILAAANRDPQAFPDPTRLDVGRSPNLHVGFGFGPHFCLGAPLARLEAEIAIPTLIRRLPQLRLLDKALEWQPHIVSRGLKELWVAY